MHIYIYVLTHIYIHEYTGNFLPRLPRGSKEDMNMVDRRAHERAAKHAPLYGDPGFIHCEFTINFCCDVLQCFAVR